MTNNTKKLLNLLEEYKKSGETSDGWTTRIRGCINNELVNIHCEYCWADIISVLDPDNMDSFILEGNNYNSRIVGCDTPLGYVNLRLITKKHPEFVA